ncbi:hypothetical protein [Xanthomarina gelatinilytica]|uniref:hypothetical protein n=1 Tax=Xanthomarina gelatinilytica TaxID=1137281 RepID=UPI001DE59B0D|nr:hypothetical protein [Winogradskyella sp.]MDX1317768.1 hypothetical protein [Xanthomarina gelatinilytica]
MMKHLYIVFLLLFLSCNNNKVVQLPEMEQADITEIIDVSPAYLFYDETKKDSIELNRKTLISTTNWLVNVDKRLTLKQAIPKIKFLQDKKRNAEIHKNDAAKNYYTCHDTSINNLGFIEFTNVYYKEKQPENHNLKPNEYLMVCQTPLNIEVIGLDIDTLKTTLGTFSKDLKRLFPSFNETKTLQLFLNNKLSFQDYIGIKSKLNKLKEEDLIIANDEFLFN